MGRTENHFASSLKKYCMPIVEDVLNGMQKNRHRVGDMKPALVPKNPILYCWWFPENSQVMVELQKFAKKDKEFASLLEQVETFKEQIARWKKYQEMQWNT